MPAKLVSDDGAHVVIRPLVYVGEDEARALLQGMRAADHRLLLSGVRRSRPAASAHEAAADGARARAPGVKNSMLKALANVAPRHLLDTRLNPPAALRRTAARTVDATASWPG